MYVQELSVDGESPHPHTTAKDLRQQMEERLQIGYSNNEEKNKEVIRKSHGNHFLVGNLGQITSKL